MNNNKIDILEFPSNLGLKKKEGVIEPGVKNLPSLFRELNFHNQIKPEQIYSLTPPEYSVDLDQESGIRNANKIIGYALEQSELLSKQLKKDHFQIVLGGDCSILIGNALALKQSGEYALFFLDGHTDFMSSEMSQTGGAAGMDLSIVTGHGHNKMTNILNLKPYFQEKNVFCIGNREYSTDYVSAILGSEIEYLDLSKLRATGLEETIFQFLNCVDENCLDGFFVHVDVDVLDDEIMPAVDSRNKDGLSYDEFSRLLIPLLSSPKAVGIEITILDPDLDKTRKYTTDFIDNFVHIIDKVKR